MLLVIAIVIIAVIIAVILKKSKVSNVSKNLESKVHNPIKKAEATIIQSSVSFVRSATTYGTTSLACAGSPAIPVYQSSFYGTVPTSGAQLYTDTTLTTFWSTANTSGYYLIQTKGAIKYAVSMNSNGTIASVVAC